jgi:NDP-sugar pyrophosphorylase family protein
MDIQYVDEQEPLGTAGGLSLVEVSDQPVLVINGDIVTKVDIRAMLDFHEEHKADMTVAVREQEFTIPYGVVEMDGVEVASISEKPARRHFINAGIYLLAPETCRMVPAGKHYDMTDLIHDVLSGGRKVVGFPIQEYWADIGQLADYEKAQIEANRQRIAG